MGHGGATISLFVLCADRCDGVDQYPCLCCWKIVAGREREMAYATLLVRFVYFITGIEPGTADEESWEGAARITGLYDFVVGRTMPVTILLPQCLLHMETGRCPHCLICCMITMMLAPSGDRAVPASLYCLICVPMTLLVMVQ